MPRAHASAYRAENQLVPVEARGFVVNAAPVGGIAAAALAAAAGLTACTSGGTVTAPSPSAVTTPTPAPVSPTRVRDVVPPGTQAPVPDGVYRVRISERELNDAGIFGSQTGGTWTLTLRHGSYQLHCARVDRAGEQCGNSVKDGGDTGMVVTAGRTAGDESTLWLIYDQETTEAVNGCATCNPTNDQLGPDRMDWTLAGQDLVLRNVWSASGADKNIPAINAYTFKPWKRIG